MTVHSQSLINTTGNSVCQRCAVRMPLLCPWLLLFETSPVCVLARNVFCEPNLAIHVPECHCGNPTVCIHVIEVTAAKTQPNSLKCHQLQYNHKLYDRTDTQLPH